MFSVPPSRLAAAFVALNGARTTSSRRCSERSVHSGECAFSTSESCATRPRIVPTVAELAAGIAIGSASSSMTWRATPIGSRKPPATRSRTVSAAVGAGGTIGSTDSGSTAGGSGASRSKSRYCSDICMPPSPSVIVWCIFDTRAALPPRSPSTTVNCQSGRVRSNGSSVISVPRSSSWRIEPGLGQGDAPDVDVDVEPGVVGPHRRRQVDRRRLHAPTQAGDVPGRPLHARPQAVEVGRAVDHRDRPERSRRGRDPSPGATSAPRHRSSCARRSRSDPRTADVCLAPPGAPLVARVRQVRASAGDRRVLELVEERPVQLVRAPARWRRSTPAGRRRASSAGGRTRPGRRR